MAAGLLSICCSGTEVRIWSKHLEEVPVTLVGLWISCVNEKRFSIIKGILRRGKGSILFTD